MAGLTEPGASLFSLRASCGCHYRLVQEYDTRDGGYKRVEVDPAEWNRCKRHAEYPHYQFAASEIASAPRVTA